MTLPKLRVAGLLGGHAKKLEVHLDAPRESVSTPEKKHVPSIGDFVLTL